MKFQTKDMIFQGGRMRRLLLAALLVVATATSSMAWTNWKPDYRSIRVDTGANVIVARQNVSIGEYNLQDYGINTSFATPEFFVAIMAPSVSLRGYMTPPRTFNGYGTMTIQQDGKPKAIPVSSEYGFSTCRLELGMPFIHKCCTIEPQVSLTRHAAHGSITGDKINIQGGSSVSNVGIGLSSNVLLTQTEMLTVHCNWSPSSTIYDVWLVRGNKHMFTGIGYTNRKFREEVLAVSFSGGNIVIGVMF